MILSLFAIFRLNNFFIKKILFEADNYSYIFERAAIKSLVVFSLEMLNVTINARDNQIAPSTF